MRFLSDADLLRRLLASIRQSRRDEVDLIALIAEVDTRRLYAHEARPSMFLYCTEVLHLSEQEAYLRITVARASREHPVLLSMLREGRLHLSGVARLTKYLTRENRDEVLRRAIHKSRREIERLIVELEPGPDAPPRMRKLPGPRVPATRSGTVEPHRAGSAAAGASEGDADEGGLAGGPGQGVRPVGAGGPAVQLCPDRVGPGPARVPMPPATVRPLAPERYRVQFTASAELYDKLERLKALMRSSVPDGDLAQIIDQAVTEKLERLEARRFAKTRSPRKNLEEIDTTPSSRHIPAAVRRAVHARDGGRCTFQDIHGRRCPARDRLEFHHHDQPFGRGGEHSVANIRLMCRTHNQLLAELAYGKDKMALHHGKDKTARHRRPGGRVSERSGGYRIQGRQHESRSEGVPP